MQKKVLVSLLFLMCPFVLFAQTEYFFYVQLKDKNNSPYSLSNPEAYLSQRAIDRRTFFNIAIDSTDLPVNPLYVSAIENENVTVFAKTKWVNGFTIKVTDSATVMPVIRNLSFIDFVEYTGKETTSGYSSVIKKNIADTANAELLYANAYQQINQINGQYLHNLGYRGDGIHIAVIDAGFINADTHVAFEKMRKENRLLGTKDFAHRQASVYNGSTHGSAVLSTIGGDVTNTFVGTAPAASYWLLRSERNGSEYPVEADLWISAAEFADSAGVDLMNTSLGYTTFDDNSLNFSYPDLDGETIRASRAAAIAASKGIVVANAAGNEGGNSWHYIGVPADAKDIIAVGSVTSAGLSSGFSSFGPTYDGRIKPEVCAMGTSSDIGYFWDTNSFTTGSGTSFASPILAGAAACLLQALKVENVFFTIPEFIQAICQSASIYLSPTTQLGYGIPNFETAYSSFGLSIFISDFFRLRDNGDSFQLDFTTENNNNVRIYSSMGVLLKNYPNAGANLQIEKRDLPKGVIIISVSNGINLTTRKIIL